jgi:hypothetical protein
LFKQKAQTDAPISDELRQVANGCAIRAKSFTDYDVNGYRFTQQATSRVGPIDKPQTAELLRPALMDSTIMEELKKSTNYHFMVPNLLLLSYSNATGFILV